jgi:hypothetical protein
MENDLNTKGDKTMWSIWDKQTEINGFSAEWVFNRHRHLQGEETIYIKTVDGHVTQIEGKSILANLYGIDPSLPDEEFIAEYERITAPEEPEPVEETNNTEE